MSQKKKNIAVLPERRSIDGDSKGTTTRSKVQIFVGVTHTRANMSRSHSMNTWCHNVSKRLARCLGNLRLCERELSAYQGTSHLGLAFALAVDDLHNRACGPRPAWRRKCALGRERAGRRVSWPPPLTPQHVLDLVTAHYLMPLALKESSALLLGAGQLLWCRVPCGLCKLFTNAANGAVLFSVYCIPRASMVFYVEGCLQIIFASANILIVSWQI